MKQAIDMGVKEICFSGGEPLLWPWIAASLHSKLVRSPLRGLVVCDLLLLLRLVKSYQPFVLVLFPPFQTLLMCGILR